MMCLEVNSSLLLHAIMEVNPWN